MQIREGGRRLSVFTVVVLGLVSVASAQQVALPSAGGDAVYQSYLAHIAAANSAIRLSEAAEAKRWLRDAPGDHASWEWRLLDAQADSSLRRLDTGDWSPVKIEFSPRGDRFCVAGSDGVAQLYSTETLHIVREFKTGDQAVYAARFNAQETRLATCNRDGKLAVWNLESGEQLWEQPSGGQGLADLAFHPNGQQLAFCSWYRGDQNVLGLVSTWNVERGEKTWQTDFGVKPIVTIRYSLDGAQLGVGTWDGLVGIWQTAALGEPRILNFHDVAGYSAIDDIRWSRDGTRIVAASKNGSPRVWNLTTDEIERDLRGHANAVFAVELTQDDQWLLSGGSDGTVTAWDLVSGGLLHRWLGHDNRISSIAIHPDGQQFATASADRTIRFWSLETMFRLDAPGRSQFTYGFALSQDGKVLAAAGQTPTDIALYDVETCGPIGQLPGLEGSVNYLDFGPDRLLVGGNWGGDVIVWDAESKSEVLRMEKGEAGGLQQCAFSPDGRWIAASTNKNLVAIWDAASGKLLHKLPLEQGCWGLDFSPDGRTLAVGDGQGTVHLVETGNWSLLGTMSGCGSKVNGLRFSPDGQRIACGCENGMLTVYEVAGRKTLFSVTGHSQRIWAVSFSHDGRRLATGGADKLVKIWDPERGVSVVTLADLPESVYNVEFAPATDDLLINAMVAQRILRVPVGLAAEGTGPQRETESK